MTTTATPSPGPAPAAPERGEPEVPRDLQVAAVLDTMVACRRTADRPEANLLALAVDYVTLHPATDLITDLDDQVTGWGEDPTDEPQTQASGPVGAVWATAGLPGRRPDTWCPLAGPGTPTVPVEAVAALGAALGVTYQAAMRLIADAVELAVRLPRLWALVHEALLACDPDAAAGREDAALHDRDVTFLHHESTATTGMTATLDTLDALDLDATLTDLAAQMARLGDTDSLGVRRAHALGSLAHPQRTLDLFGDPRPATLTDDDVSAGSSGGKPRSGAITRGPWNQVPWNATTATLYLHVTADDLRTHTGGGTVEKLGPATLDLLRDWLHRVDKVTVRPVLDITTTDSVDQHDPPDPMRHAVILRDGHCVFPGCTVDARGCDLDHTIPYVPLDEGGPPGQTGPSNLACLCRRHRRLKTFAAWSYHHTSSGDYAWTSPTGRTYTTHPQPTTAPRRC